MDGPLLLYDGECGLCHGVVRFVLRWERAPAIRFSALQSATGRAWAGRAGAGPNTMLFVEGETVRMRSDAALAVARHLRAPWRWLRVMRLLPRGFRDAIYDGVARNRHFWFGRTACVLPAPGQSVRFVD